MYLLKCIAFSIINIGINYKNDKNILYMISKYIKIKYIIYVTYMSNNIIQSLMDYSNLVCNNYIEKNTIEECSQQSKDNTLLPDKKEKKIKNISNIQLDYNTYIKEDINLQKFKLHELKSISKQHGLHITGTKTILINRIENLFNEIKKTIIIQKYFRRHIVMILFKKRGDGFKNISLCVNESDGYTLEPLIDIPIERFFSYKDSNDFVYGFDIFTLYSMIKKSSKPATNPYTREQLNINIVNDIITVASIIKIIYPYVTTKEENDILFIKQFINRENNNRNNRSIRRNRILLQPTRELSRNFIEFDYNGPLYYRMHFLNQITINQKEILDKLLYNRSLEVERRIEESFSEINQLGNYANSNWLLQLNQPKIFSFIRMLKYIWDYRFNIPTELKSQLCQFGDPFHILQLRSLSLYMFDINQTIECCINVIDYFIYSGIDIECRRLGAMYVLIALTSVSVDARNNIPWLYETIRLNTDNTDNTLII